MKNKKLFSLLIVVIVFVSLGFSKIDTSLAEVEKPVISNPPANVNPIAIDPETFGSRHNDFESHSLRQRDTAIDPETFVEKKVDTTSNDTNQNTDVVLPVLPLKVSDATIESQAKNVPLLAPVVVATDEPTVKIIVNVINDNQGQNSPSDFIISVSGASAKPSFFKGSSLGTDISVSPNLNYSVFVSTLTYTSSYSPNCSGSLVAGSQVTCTVTLNDINSNGTNPLNLIQNSSVESAITLVDQPDSWIKGGYGINDRELSYPVLGVNGGKAVKVAITSFTNGDVKWYFKEVPVLSGHSYVFNDNYISDTETELSVEYFDANHNHLSYGEFIALPAFSASLDGSWKTNKQIFTPPTGVSFMTVFHSLKSIGSLTTDNFSLIEVPLSESFDHGFVSLSFDDGLASQYKNAFPELSLSGIKGTFYLISHAISGLSIRNSSLEEESSTPGIPDGWNFLGGVNTLHTYPINGHTGYGVLAGSLVSNTNAGWYFNPISVINDSVYSFSEWYKSTTNSELVAIINRNDGTTIEADVTDENGITLGPSVSLPSTNNNWTEVNTHFYIPIDTKNVTIVNRIKGVGNLTIDDVLFGNVLNMNSDQVKSLIGDGQEIGAHSQSHADLTALSSVDAKLEINGIQLDLLKNGLNKAFSFSYPYGLYNETIQGITKTSGYTSGRTVASGFNGKDTDKFGLLTESVNADTPLSTVESWINQSYNDHTWLILVFHDILNNLSNKPFDTSPENLQAIINYLKDYNVPTATISQGINLMNNVIPTPILTTINITPGNPSGVVGDTVMFTATALDQNGLEMNPQPVYTWSSSNVAVATINPISGFATAVGPGSTTITATNGGITGATVGTVSAVTPPVSTLNSISITTKATKLTYKVGDPLDIRGLVVTGTYSDNLTKIENITPSDVVGFNSSAPAINQVLTIMVAGKTTTYKINIVTVTPPAVVLNSIAITNPATKLTYKVGEPLSLAGLIVIGTYSDNSTKIENINLSNITGFDSSKPIKDQVLTITVGGKTTTFKISIVATTQTDPDKKPHKKSSGSIPFINKQLEKLNNKLNEGNVLGASTFKFVKDLKNGMSHNDIKELQTRLKDKAIFSGPITGYFGPQTLSAVKKYQAQNGLHQDGLVGPKTRTLLNAS